MWLETEDARSRDRNPTNFTLDLVSDRSANKHTTLAEGILKVLCSNSSSSSVRLFTFLYPIGYQSAQFFRRALHYASSGRQFLHQNAQPLWRSLYIVIHRQTVSVYQNSSVWLDTSVARSRDRNPSNFTLDLVYITIVAAACTDFPDPFSLFVSIIHCSQQVFHALSCINTELL